MKSLSRRFCLVVADAVLISSLRCSNSTEFHLQRNRRSGSPKAARQEGQTSNDG